ncbi:ABC transporter substrate-binding protein [Oricola thermophila]|uniref:ABC transporter substrate-binding protein n=1 Tax=Oricola thermophila TaxID=2742145 RepID=A0A6N1VE43_9HYPH|nr:ABC transporter substrate-binding protein [Oricola thermophila]QKV19124.1 ABC transporter substrate-binding protein [Oricola thermophila]
MSSQMPLTRRTCLLSATTALIAGMVLHPLAAGAQDVTTITAALASEPQSLDPIYDTDLPALNVFYNVYDQLTAIDFEGKVSPALAEEWFASEDLKTWTFKLRSGASFHDGSPVTAADVVFTYETAMNDPASRLGGYLGQIETVKAVSDHEVEFRLKSSFAPFDRQVTLVPIVCKAAYEKMGAAEFARKPIGSGAYSVEDWAAGGAITLKRFDDYWGGKGTYETVKFLPVPDETTRANAIQSGDLDIALLGPSAVPAVRASGAVDVIDQNSNRIIYVGFNSNAQWLGDVRIRKAVDFAIDRVAIGERLLNGAVTPSSQLVAPVSFGYDTSIPATSHDLDKAKELVEASGYDGAPLTLSYPTAIVPQSSQIAQAIAYFLEEAGLNVELDGREYSTMINDWFSSSLPGMYIMAFAPTMLDADLPFDMLLRTGGQGYTFDPEIDALLDAQLAEPDQEKRAEIFSRITAKVNETTSYAPLFSDTYTYGVTKGLNWRSRPDGLIVLK